MCGISGIMTTSGRAAGPLVTAAKGMSRALSHRGPDDEAIWTDGTGRVAFGFRRLAIQDLTPTGRQPMTSASGRFTIEYNGEIYNFKELRDELSALGHAFRGSSDTEVMLAAFEAWGVLGGIGRFVGMFAFAVWDRDEEKLWLVRDRLGEKPLYYGRVGDTFAFASELKAFRALPDFRPRVDRDALALFLRYAYVPSPKCIYEGFAKLPPAHYVVVHDGVAAVPRPYWSLAGVVRHGREQPFTGTEDEAADLLEATLRRAVKRCMVADVPLGVFLSGGVDSSTVVALMQAQSDRPVHTFTIGFEDAAYDEADDAAAVAKHLGTQHTELRVTAREAQEVVPRLADIYDEPFADASQIPTFLVARLARRSVTVALSGDGGDEVFGGYNRYFLGAGLLGKAMRLPRPARRMLAGMVRAASPRTWDRWVGPLVGRRVRPGTLGTKAHKAAAVLADPRPDARYEHLVSVWADPATVLRAAPGRNGVQLEPPLRHPVERMMFLDTLTYLPDDILVKVDRATMAVSLEARAPYLGHDVIELAWRLPLEHKVHGGRGKKVLRRVLHRHVPPELVDRPKMGFGVPLAEWLRGPLRAWAEALLEPARLQREGFFDAAAVQKVWQEHLSGHDRAARLWCLLMFQAWLERHPVAEAT